MNATTVKTKGEGSFDLYLFLVSKQVPFGWSFNERTKINTIDFVNEDTEEYSKFLVQIANEAENIGPRKVAKSFREALAL